jgi:hypothetical protein
LKDQESGATAAPPHSRIIAALYAIAVYVFDNRPREITVEFIVSL